jgi:hypothetical protein
MKRRPATTPIDGHAQGYFTAPFAQPLLSLSTSNTRLLCGLCLHTHNYGTVSSPAVRSSIWDFLLTKKFLLGDIFQWKYKTHKTKKSNILTGERSKSLWILPPPFPQSFGSWQTQNQAIKTTVVLRIEKKNKYEIKATFEQQLNVFFKHGLPLMIKNTIAFLPG